MVLSILTEGSEFVATHQKYFGTEDNSGEFHRLLFGILVSSICTFGISFSTSWCVRITGATTYRYFPLTSMVGALNKLPIAVFGMVFFDAVVSFASISSVIIGI